METQQIKLKLTVLSFFVLFLFNYPSLFLRFVDFLHTVTPYSDNAPVSRTRETRPKITVQIIQITSKPARICEQLLSTVGEILITRRESTEN